MTIKEKITTTTAEVQQAAEQKQFWYEKHLICLGRLSTLQEMEKELEGAEQPPIPLPA